MANKEEIEIVLDLLHQNRPVHSYESLMKNEIGIMGVIKFLSESEIAGKGEIKSKDISDELKISSARMTVLLKKLETKGLVEKTVSKIDARVVFVKLSDKGSKFASIARAKMNESAENLIDEFGIEHLVRVFSDMQKIKNIMEKNIKLEDFSFES